MQSDFSCEEDEEEYEDNEKTVKDFNQEEQLENAENQKISSEKMSSNMHRLHVEFDDLSVVDEEEEPKRDKEKKETTPEKGQEIGHPPPPILGPRQLHDNIPFYPATYEPTSGFSGTSYYTECPFEFPSTVDLMLSTDTSALLASPYSGLQPDPLIPLTNLDAAGLEAADPTLPQIHVPPVGWQNDMVSQKQVPTYTGNVAPVTPIMRLGKPDSHQIMVSSLRNSVPPSNTFGFLRRNASTEEPTKLHEVSANQNSQTQFSCSEEAIGGNVWNMDSFGFAGTNREKNIQQVENTEEATTTFTVPEKPKYFFAPQPFRLNKQKEESPTASVNHFGTGTSSSSGKTASTVISKTNPFIGLKGSADIYINGAIPCENAPKDKNDSKTFLSIDNLSITDNRSAPLTKSVSCQDLLSDSQSIARQLNHVESQTLTKSDNTLDNISGSFSKPYKSHLNVTLKIPQVDQTSSPETPEIPNLPSIDYRLFRNPFLRNFDKICPNHQVKPNPPPATTPLSIQVNDDGLVYPMPGYGRGVRLNERFRAAHLPNQSRLLIPSDQLMSGKQDIQVTSFERPSPCNLIPSATPYDLTNLRRLNANRYLQNQNLYQNVPFVSRGSGQFYSQRCGMHYDNVTKVPAQTQTSIDGDSHHEDEETSTPNSPNGQRRKKIVKKDKILIKDQKPLSPAIQRRLRKQISVTSTDTLNLSEKMTRKKEKRRLSTMMPDVQENKNESRSSSSGQDSPRKDRRVSVYINSKKRPSQASLKTTRSDSVDVKDKFMDGVALNSERERTNSVSSREIANVKARKTSTSSGNVPWCACWGNGCI